MNVSGGNLFTGVPTTSAEEQITPLLVAPSVRIERIVSHGQASPPGFWYDQAKPEWVIVLAGSAAVLFEGEPAPRVLERGDYVHIPAHVRHRVEWTDAGEPTIWLALHYW
jgi:cupin 2 domain-containing protein